MVSSLAAMFLVVGLQAKEPEWSPAVDGLEGRVEFKVSDSMSSPIKITPYVVLHNSGPGNVSVWFAQNFENVALKLVDAKGVVILQSPISHIGAVPPPFSTFLPRDATVRLNTATWGMSVGKDARILILTGLAGLTLPKGFTGDAFVTGTYTVSFVEGLNSWTGTLNLPKVKIWHGGNLVVTPSLP